MKRFAFLLPLLLIACAGRDDKPKPPQVLGANITGVLVAYQGDTSALRESDIIARQQCERYNRGAALVNDIPTTSGTSYAYYYCQ